MLRELWNDAAGGFHPASAPDFLPDAALKEVQLRRLRAVVQRAFDNVALFRERCASVTSGPRRSSRSRTSVICPSRSRPTCAIPIRSVSSPAR